MNKTTLTESMIEEIIMLETLAAMKDRGLLPEYNTKMKEKVDLLKEGDDLNEVLSTLLKIGASGVGAATATAAKVGGALAKGGKGVAASTNLGLGALATGLGVAGAGAVTGRGEEEEEEEEIPEEEKTWLQKKKEAIANKVKKEMEEFGAKGPGGKDREQFMRQFEDSVDSAAGKKAITTAELFIDIVGPAIGALVPIWGDFIDLLVAAKNFYKRDYVNAMIMVAAATPGLGIGFGALSIAIKTGNKVGIRKAARALVETGLIGKRSPIDDVALRSASYVDDVARQLTDRALLQRIFDRIPARGYMSRAFGLPVGNFDQFVRYMIQMTDVPFRKASVMRQMSYPLSMFIQKLAASEYNEETGEMDYDFNEGLDFANEQIHRAVTQGIPAVARVAAKATEKATKMVTTAPRQKTREPRGEEEDE